MRYVTKRAYNERCKWWKYDEENPDMEVLKNNIRPSGIFYARQIEDEGIYENADNGMVDIDTQVVTIETQYDIYNLKPKDLVFYDNQLWIVEPPIRSTKYIRNTEYNKRAHRIYKIILRNKGR